MIDKSWTLFLDRDGVINPEKKEDYILHVGEFGFYAGVLEAMPVFNQLFGTIVMVTNQKGIGKGLMTVDDLARIHGYMMGEMQKQGGRIDKIYFAPDLDQNAYNRKPNPGMAAQAKTDFPAIDFTKSVMVGNKLSDMEFAHNAGIAHSVFLATTNPETPFPHPWIAQRFNSLAEYASHLQALTKA